MIHIIHTLSVSYDFFDALYDPLDASAIFCDNSDPLYDIPCDIFDSIFENPYKNHHYHRKTLGHSHASKYQSTRCF